jgi:hypothetical protein
MTETGNLRGEHNLRGARSHAIQSQYSASARILSLARTMQETLDPSEDIDIVYEKCFNIYTAEGVSLDNWGRILNIARNIEWQGTLLALDDELYRLLLLYKALANISPGNAQTLNMLLAVLVNTGIGGLPRMAYILEVDTMVIRWVFEDTLSQEQRAVLFVAGMFARPGGVGWELYGVNPAHVFGFDGSGMNPFDQAPFAPDDALIVGY